MFFDFLFPNRCLHCNRIISSEEVVCEICVSQVLFTHFDYNENNLLKEKCKTLFPIEHAYALMQFEKEGLARKIIHQLKYSGRENIAKVLANWTLKELYFKNSPPDILIPIPLHAKKMRKRGYNQLHLFTKILSLETGVPYDFEILKRDFNNKAQAMKNKDARLKTNNPFSVSQPISGKNILLIDDVFTTGNTITSAAWELLNAKANSVSILIMAMDS